MFLRNNHIALKRSAEPVRCLNESIARLPIAKMAAQATSGMNSSNPRFC